MKKSLTITCIILSFFLYNKEKTFAQEKNFDCFYAFPELKCEDFSDDLPEHKSNLVPEPEDNSESEEDFEDTKSSELVIEDSSWLYLRR